MSKFIIYNKAKINDDEALTYAAETVKKCKSMLKAVGTVICVEYHNLIKGEIIKNKTCYTIVIY